MPRQRPSPLAATPRAAPPRKRYPSSSTPWCVSGNSTANGLGAAPTGDTVASTPAQIRTAYGISNLSAGWRRPDHRHRRRLRQSGHLPGPRHLRRPVRPVTASSPSALPAVRPGVVVPDRRSNRPARRTGLPGTDPGRGVGSANWELEESLDVEWAHAIAPGRPDRPRASTAKSLSDLMASVATGRQPSPACRSFP